MAYHPPSGKTLFLNAASHELLTELLREPRDIDSICAELTPSEAGDLGASERHREQLAALLDHLEQLGLVSRA